MPWASNPLLASSSATLTPSPPAPDDNQDATSSQTEKVDDDSDGFQRPTDRFTPHQIFYIFVLDGIGAAVVSGAINLAIAYGNMPFPKISQCAQLTVDWPRLRDVRNFRHV